METLGHSWLSLMSSANDIVKNGIDFLNARDSATIDESSSVDNKAMWKLHQSIVEMTKKLDALDEKILCSIFESSSKDLNTLTPERVPENNINITTRENSSETASLPLGPGRINVKNENNKRSFESTLPNLIAPGSTVHPVQTPKANESSGRMGKTSLNFTFKPDILRNISTKLRQRYEGLPHPPNAEKYGESDIQKDKEVFQLGFPITQSKESHELIDATSDNPCQPEQQTQRKASRLSLGPPRKPRGSRNPLLYAEERQKEILSKPFIPLRKPRWQDESPPDGDGNTAVEKNQKVTRKLSKEEDEQIDDADFQEKEAKGIKKIKVAKRPISTENSAPKSKKFKETKTNSNIPARGENGSRKKNTRSQSSKAAAAKKSLTVPARVKPISSVKPPQASKKSKVDSSESDTPATRVKSPMMKTTRKLITGHYVARKYYGNLHTAKKRTAGGPK